MGEKKIVQISLAHIVTKSVGPAARCSKAIEEARLVERKVCFASDVGNQLGRGRRDDRLLSKGRLPPLTTSEQEFL